MKKNLLTLLLICFYFTASQAFAYEDELDGLLKDYVALVEEEQITYNGIHYDSWSQDKRGKKVIKALQKKDLKTLKTDSDQLAFWINAYNVFLIDLIIQEGERDSVQDLNGAKSVWDNYKWSIDGDVYTLNDIVEKVKQLQEPKAFFALSCASKSCVDIRQEAYRAQDLDKQLNNQMRLTLQNEAKGFKGPRAAKNRIIVNNLFKTYKDQFNKGKVKSWLQPIFPDDINVGTAVQFFKHDWALNNAKK